MSLLLDALKNAEQAKARNVSDQAKPSEPEALRITTACESESEVVDPTELLSNAVLELEISKDQIIIDDEEDVGVSVGTSVETPKEDDKSEIKLDLESKPELIVSPESESVESDPQELESSSTQPANNDLTIDHTKAGRKHEAPKVKVEQQFEVPANKPHHNTLTLKPENAAQARQILNTPSRLNNNRWLGLGLASLVILFCGGGYVFYVTTALPPLPNFAQLSDSNTGVEAGGEIVDIALGSTEPMPVVEPVKNPTPLLAAETKSVRAAGPVIAPSGLSRNTIEAAVADDVQIVAQPIKIKKTRVPQSINKQLNKAYTALQNKDFKMAKLHYGNVLKTSRKNVDALLGMGTIASRELLPSVARDYFNKALQNDPSNVYANSALFRLQRENDPLESESRLKTLIAANRNSAYLHFNLANLYAAQSRWSDAESAYFNAYNLDKSKPDYAYNLAISLDHLGKKGVARRFYRTALHLAEDSPAHFDVPAVRKRLVQIHHG